jgi:hypothetical protein
MGAEFRVDGARDLRIGHAESNILLQRARMLGRPVERFHDFIPVGFVGLAAPSDFRYSEI